jgi:hypothetical protein
MAMWHKADGGDPARPERISLMSGGAEEATPR